MLPTVPLASKLQDIKSLRVCCLHTCTFAKAFALLL